MNTNDKKVTNPMHEPEADTSSIRKPGKNHREPRNYVYGLAGLAELLGCTVSTAWRIKKRGVLNAAISQTGHIIVVDADKALELISLRRKGK